MGCERRSEGRRRVLQPQVSVWMCVCIERARKAGERGCAKKVRRRGRRRELGSILAVWWGCGLILVVVMLVGGWVDGDLE